MKRSHQPKAPNLSAFFIVGSALGLVLLFGHFSPATPPTDPKEIALRYCGSCHVAPDPTALPRSLWAKTILPEMGSYYGIKREGFGILKKMEPEELAEVKALSLYPDKQLLSDDDWLAIQRYYLSNAPEEIAIDRSRWRRNKKLQAFEAEDIDLLGLPGSLITAMAYHEQRNQLWVGEDRLMAYSWKHGRKNVQHKTTTQSTVSHIAFDRGDTYLVQMGSLVPTSKRNGTLSLLSGEGPPKTIIKNLHRPVHTLVEDLNNDGSVEIVVSNFGHRTGSLSLYSQNGTRFEEQVILRQAGALKCIAHDMNADGRMDLVALFAQGDEGIYIGYQQQDLTFETERVLRFDPLSGSNDFVMVDYEGDGDLDLVVAQGDNADLSVTPKAFHGIRLFINEQNTFTEQFFHPLYGATKVLAEDFDQDGDIDLIATAFYQQYETVPNEGLVYLENLDADHFEFQSFELKNRDPIKSYALQKGDIDQDGDVDVVVGLFSSTITHVPDALREAWHQADYDITVLLNQLN